MLFNSFEYLVFFPVIFLLYFIIPRKLRCLLLLVASYFFYMNWNWKYGSLLLFATLSTYVASLWISQYKRGSFPRRMVITLCLLANVGILIYFKYFNFVLGNVNKILSISGAKTFDAINVILPVGISFYIFQALSYLLDVNAERIAPEKNIIRYALFVSFFPQLVAGPIERSDNLLRQIQNVTQNSRFQWKEASRGFTIMLWGFFTKMVVADRIAVFVDAVFNNYTNYGRVELILAAIGFAVQIYCDFSGYSSIAIGSAKILGFDLMDNFKSPYYSGSVKEFWRRWHISLSTWFRDYLYIPLGGSRKGKFRKYLNLMITMGVSGLWHGASWAFVAWGLLHGFYQVMEDVLKTPIRKINQLLGTNTEVFSYHLLKRITTFILVDLAWIFFRADSLKIACKYILRIFRNPNTWVLFDNSLFTLGLDVIEIQVLICALILLFVVDWIQYKYNERIDMLLERQNLWFRYVVLIALFTIVWVFGVYGPTFDSSQFIYFQF